jgi:uncharacterized protein YjgD (DUF1641 family)
MDNTNIQTQINELNQKVDLILDHVNQQRLKADAIEDLISDFSIIGKDVYDSTVSELEDRAIEINPDELRLLGVRFLKNIKNFNNVLSTFESVTDFAQDAAPIANEMIIDFMKKLHEVEEKGYFEFLKEASKIIDNIVTNFSAEDVQLLADNIVTILNTVKGITQPEMLNSVNNALKAYGSMEMETVPEYSIWKLMRELNKPEMKRAIGFAVTFMKNISSTNK